MATVCLLPQITSSALSPLQHIANLEETNIDELESLKNSTESPSAKSNNDNTSAEPPKVNYQRKIQQFISISFTSSLHLIFLTWVLSISKFCNAAAMNAAQVTAGTPSPSLLVQNLNGSALLEKIRASTLGPPLDKLKNFSPAVANSLASRGSNAVTVTTFSKSSNINKEFKFQNISGKINTQLDISASLPKICEEKQLQCRSGECIPIRFVCDGDSDCKDHSDELRPECKLKNSTCGIEQFRCASGNCIPNKWRCDHENDCSDGSDEASTLCKMKTCSPEEFACKSDGRCISLSWMCDQFKDCTDGSDETSCNATCRSDEFTCKNGLCIQKRWQCDLDDDCGDSSDEVDCPPVECPEHSTFMCDSGACIVKRWVCDSDADCPDGSDERNCGNTTHIYTPCQPHEYMCKDRITCLHQNWLCDGDQDCPDGDDELQFNCKILTCPSDQFQCEDRTCIAGHLFCNSIADCKDGSDEKDCHLSAKPYSCNATHEFNCGGGQCIPLAKACDKRKDCPDGEDEPAGTCGVNECASLNAGCMHRCVDQPIGYRCECHEGYQLTRNGQTCVDINECEIPGACSQLCVNEIGGYKCECEAGYMRDPRNHTRCKATEGHASLLLASRHDIGKISLDHMEITSIVNSTKSATALDFVFRTGMIFWSDVTTQSIYKAPIEEGDEKSVVIKKASVISDGLAVDWIYNHVYFTDSHKCTIELTNFEGTIGKVLIGDELDIPRSIALDPIEGWMYWSDWGASPRIERAGMDGSHRTTIINYDVKWPNGITLDRIRRRLYWVDGKLNIISSANYDGSQRSQILYSTEYLRHPFSITTFEDYIYWTDWDKQTVFKANKFTGEGVEPITDVHMFQHPMVIHVYHPYCQPDDINHCQSVNGRCSHLCLPAPRITERSPRISCACPAGLKLMADRLTCITDLTPRQTHPLHRNLTQLKVVNSPPFASVLPLKLPHNNTPTEVTRTGSKTDMFKSNNCTEKSTTTTIFSPATYMEENYSIIQHPRHTATPMSAVETEAVGTLDMKSIRGLNQQPYDTYSGQFLYAACSLLCRQLIDDKRLATTNKKNTATVLLLMETATNQGSLSEKHQKSEMFTSSMQLKENRLHRLTSTEIMPALVTNLAMSTSLNSYYSQNLGLNPKYLHWLCQKMKYKLLCDYNPATASPVDKKSTGNVSYPVNKGAIATQMPEPDSVNIALIVVAGIALLTALGGAICWAYMHCERTGNSMNFENPIYRKTTDRIILEKDEPTHMFTSTMEEEVRTPLRDLGTACV